MKHTPEARLGFWSAALTAAFSIIYGVAQIGVLAVRVTPPWDGVAVFAPSLFIPWAFVVMMASIHHEAPTEKRVWSQVGLTFAVLYAAFVSIVYSVQLFVVAPKALAGRADKVALLAFTPGSFSMVVDGLGYGFMSLATLFAAPVFARQGQDRWTRRFFILHGTLVVPILLAYVTNIAWLGVPWLVTAPAAAILAAARFRRMGATPPLNRPAQSVVEG